VDDLVAFLTARLDEAAAGAWSVHDVARCDALLYEEDLPPAAARTPDCDCGYPARVLREVEAGRALLLAYEASVRSVGKGLSGQLGREVSRRKIRSPLARGVLHVIR
jgi:hypothetical protein